MKKRLLSTIAASTLIAAQVVAPVMAADGTINVNVSDKEAVIRVVVPTALEIAVDQFETVDAGTQIYSEPFAMENKSAVPVKVSVTSTATLGTGIDFVSKVSDANPETPSATGGKAWLAVAAQTSSGKYIEESGKGVGDLTEASGNVTVFDATSKAASQDFYLAKGSGNAAYKLLDYDTATAAGVPSYAKFYELTAAGTLANDAALQAKVDAGDVYYEATTGAGTNGNALTKIAKGTADVTLVANSTYYTVGTTAATPAASKIYVYAEMGTAGANTAFRYIGKLEDAKSSWSKDDIKTVKIEYDIDGVTASNYTEAAKNCTYGLYSAPGTDMSAGTAKGTVQYTTANVSEVVSINLTNATGTYDAMKDNGSYYSKATSAVSGANTVITFDAKYIAFFSEDTDATIVYVDKDGKQKTQIVKVKMTD